MKKSQVIVGLKLVNNIKINIYINMERGNKIVTSNRK